MTDQETRLAKLLEKIPPKCICGTTKYQYSTNGKDLIAYCGTCKRARFYESKEKEWSPMFELIAKWNWDTWKKRRGRIPYGDHKWCVQCKEKFPIDLLRCPNEGCHQLLRTKARRNSKV